MISSTCTQLQIHTDDIREARLGEVACSRQQRRMPRPPAALVHPFRAIKLRRAVRHPLAPLARFPADAAGPARGNRTAGRTLGAGAPPHARDTCAGRRRPRRRRGRVEEAHDFAWEVCAMGRVQSREDSADRAGRLPQPSHRARRCLRRRRSQRRRERGPYAAARAQPPTQQIRAAPIMRTRDRIGGCRGAARTGRHRPSPRT